MRKLNIVLALLAVLVWGKVIYVISHQQSTNDWMRDRVVLLHSNVGSCTGVAVKAPSGKVYTLTAAHCRELIVNSMVMAQLENGTEVPLKMVAIDIKHDLMLLSDANDEKAEKSITIADKIEDKHLAVHTMTRGLGLPSHRADGEFLKEITFMFPSRDSASSEMQITEMMITAHADPGSSGGPVLNDREELVGIVSCILNSQITTIVQLKDIKAFLNGH
jgi:S1-C subfamily serine protease